VLHYAEIAETATGYNYHGLVESIFSKRTFGGEVSY